MKSKKSGKKSASKKVKQAPGKNWKVKIISDEGKLIEIYISLGTKSEKADVIEFIKRQGIGGEIISITEGFAEGGNLDNNELTSGQEKELAKALDEFQYNHSVGGIKEFPIDKKILLEHTIRFEGYTEKNGMLTDKGKKLLRKYGYKVLGDSIKEVAQRITVSMDGATGETGDALPAWSFGDLWNGFAVPYFEKNQADQIVKDMNESQSGKNHYDSDKDAYIFVIEDAQPDIFEAQTIKTLEGDKKVYPIGAYSWVWWDNSFAKGGSLSKDEQTAIDNQPDYENDCFIDNSPHSGVNVSCAGKFLGHFEETDNALKAIADWQKNNNWFPTIWHVSDHGNMWPVDSEGNQIKMAKGGKIETQKAYKFISEETFTFNITIDNFPLEVNVRVRKGIQGYEPKEKPDFAFIGVDYASEDINGAEIFKKNEDHIYKYVRKYITEKGLTDLEKMADGGTIEDQMESFIDGLNEKCYILSVYPDTWEPLSEEFNNEILTDIENDGKSATTEEFHDRLCKKVNDMTTERLIAVVKDVLSDEFDEEYASGGKLDRGERPSPKESATLYPVGFMKEGQDGNTWMIVSDKRGVQRWQKQRIQELATAYGQGGEVCHKEEYADGGSIDQYQPKSKLEFIPPPTFKSFSMFSDIGKFKKAIVDAGYVIVDVKDQTKTSLYISIYLDKEGGYSYAVNTKGSDLLKYHEKNAFSGLEGKPYRAYYLKANSIKEIQIHVEKVLEDVLGIDPEKLTLKIWETSAVRKIQEKENANPKKSTDESNEDKIARLTRRVAVFKDLLSDTTDKKQKEKLRRKVETFKDLLEMAKEKGNKKEEKKEKVSGYEVELSAVPNPDYAHDSTRKEGKIKIAPYRVKIDDIPGARAIVLKFIEDNDLGGGNFTGGVIYKDGKAVAHVSYNGRIWEGEKHSENNKELFPDKKANERRSRILGDVNYSSGEGLGSYPGLDKIKRDDLDEFEQKQYDHAIKSGRSHVEALQIIINTVEGDISQLSKKLSLIARKQQKEDQKQPVNSTEELQDQAKALHMVITGMIPEKEDVWHLVKEKDIKKLLDAGYKETDVIAIYLGADKVYIVNIDAEFVGYAGLISYRDDYIDKMVDRYIDAMKQSKFAIGLKYPTLDWSEIIKKYKISPEAKTVKEKFVFKDGDYDITTQEIFEGNKVVVGHAIKHERYKNNALYETIEEKNEVKDPLKDGFNNGYWGIASSDINIIRDLAHMILGQSEDHYVKDFDIFVNTLGGVVPGVLDENGVKYKDGGSLERIGVADIKQGARFKTKSGMIWIIDEVKPDPDYGFAVRTSFEGGGKGNYGDGIADVVAFLNEEGAVKLEDKKAESGIVLNIMKLSEHSLKSILNEISYIKHDLSAIKDYDRKKITISELQAITLFQPKDKMRLQEALLQLIAEKNRRHQSMADGGSVPGSFRVDERYTIKNGTLTIRFDGKSHKYPLVIAVDKDDKKEYVDDMSLDYGVSSDLFKFMEKKFYDWLEQYPENSDTRQQYEGSFEEMGGGSYLDKKGAIIMAIDAIYDVIIEKQLRFYDLDKEIDELDLPGIWQP